MFKGLVRPELSEIPNVVPAVRVCSVHTVEDRHFVQVVSAVPLRSPTENSDQDKSDTSGLLESCLQLLFHFATLFMVQEVGLQMRCATGLDAA
jgi:hypothetical protein